MSSNEKKNWELKISDIFLFRKSSVTWLFANRILPFGKYKNPKIIDEEALYMASELLQTNTIICGDYKTVLLENAKSGDFVFHRR